MTDYLGHLAERSLNLASPLRPKLPSLFEPVPAVAAPFSIDRMPKISNHKPDLSNVEASRHLSLTEEPFPAEMPAQPENERSSLQDIIEESSSQIGTATQTGGERAVEFSSKRQQFQSKMPTPKDIEQPVEISSSRMPLQSKMPTPKDIDPSILHGLIKEPFHEKTLIMRQDNHRHDIPSTKISSSTSSLGNSPGKEMRRKATVTAGLNGDRGIVQKKTFTVQIPPNRPGSEIYAPSSLQSTEKPIVPINASVDFSRNMNREARQSISDEERSFAVKFGQLIAPPQGRRNYEEIPSSGIGKASIRPRSELPETASSPESKSTIKVSIGRIDVRSENKAVPPPQETSIPAPRLSLDEYLKRRNEGHL